MWLGMFALSVVVTIGLGKSEAQVLNSWQGFGRIMAASALFSLRNRAMPLLQRRAPGECAALGL